MTPRLSVIVIARAGDHLDDQITALTSQVPGTQPFETVVVMGAGSRKMKVPAPGILTLALMPDTADFALLVNAGVRHASHEHVVIVSADDIVAPWFVKSAHEGFTTSEVFSGSHVNVHSWLAKRTFEHNHHPRGARPSDTALDHCVFAISRQLYFDLDGLDWSGVPGLSKRVVAATGPILTHPGLIVAHRRSRSATAYLADRFGLRPAPSRERIKANI